MGAVGEGIPMLLSGLWKLAAMASVVGVGLVAVYQAQQGMDKSAITVSDSAVPDDPTGDALADDSEATSVEPEKLPPDPFVTDTLKSLNLTAKVPTEKESGPTPLAPPSEELLTGPGLDFRADPETAAQTTPSSDGKPARLPDDLELLEAEVLEAKLKSPDTKSADTKSADTNTADIKSADNKSSDNKSAGITPADIKSTEAVLPDAIKRFVRQVRATDDEPAAEADSDPFATDASPFETATETVKAADVEVNDESKPMFKANTSPAPASAPDPFEENTDLPAPANAVDFLEVKSKEDPFPAVPPPKRPVEDSAGKKAAPAVIDFGEEPIAPKSRSPQLPSLPLPDDTRSTPPVSEQGSDNFGAEGVPEPGFPDSQPRRVPPRLPTEVPDPSDEFPTVPPATGKGPGENSDGLPSLTREPRSAPAPLPERNPRPVRLPEPADDELFGDGTVDRTSPRGVQQARVTIEKIAPQQATLGEPLVYSVIVKNVGGIDATQVIVEDRIPKGTELTGTAPRAEMIDKKLIWRIGTLRPNEEKKISIRVIPRQEGPVGSLARVSFATEVAAEIQVSAPQLSFRVNAPRQARMGETIELTFTLKNTGTAAASNVSVRDLVPPGLKHEAASDIECPIGKLAPGETREIVLAVTAVKPGRVTNRAILSGDGGIGEELESVIEIIGEQLVLTRSGHSKVYVDRPVVFTNNVKNEGNASVKQVRVSEIVPAGMDFVEASDGGRFDPVQRAIFWDLGALPAGAEAAVTSKLIARTPGSQPTKITAAGPAGSTASVNSEIEAVGRPELQIETVGRTGVINVGDRLTSKIQLKNHGSAAANNVALSIQLPRELKLIEVRGSQYSVRNQSIVFSPVAAIGPRESAAFEIVMEAVTEAEAQMTLEISADHLSKPARRSETLQIAAEVRE